MSMTDKKELIRAAYDAMQNSYSPYSNFKVGAALLCKNGKVYTGCNIENSAFTPTVCAERTAFYNAINSGEREFSAIAVIGGKNGEITDRCLPCGVCRQVMAEFCSPDFEIIVAANEEIKTYLLKDILPNSFQYQL